MIRAAVIACATMELAAAPASDVPTVQVTLQDHRFTPDVISVPAGQRIRIEVANRDATGDDFDSDALHVDKDIAPHGRVAFVIGPLKPGTYPFKAELHAETAHGTVVATEPAAQ